MIPLPLPGVTWLASATAKRVLLWINVGVIVLLVALLVWFVQRVTAWAHAYDRLPVVEAELELEQACGDGSKCWQRSLEWQTEQSAKIQEVMETHGQELAALLARPIERRVIRVCPDPGSGSVRGGAAAAGNHGAAAAAGPLLGSDELDTSPLRELALEADQVSARLRGCQGWAEAVSAEPAP